jgi:hypothetical protein
MVAPDEGVVLMVENSKLNAEVKQCPGIVYGGDD